MQHFYFENKNKNSRTLTIWQQNNVLRPFPNCQTSTEYRSHVLVDFATVLLILNVNNQC